MYRPGVNFINFFILAIIFISHLFLLSSCSTLDNSSSKKTEIAVILPLTGIDVNLGNRLKNIINSVYGLNSSVNNFYKLSFYDSANEEQLEKNINNIINKNTKIIIGPLYSKTALKIIPYIKDTDILMFTLSNDKKIARGNIYTFGHEPMKQINLLMAYLTSGIYQDFVLLLPANKGSNILSKYLGEKIKNKGLNSVETIYYTDSEESIKRSIFRLDQIINDFNENVFSQNKPVVVLTGNNTESLKFILREFKKNNIDKKALVTGDCKIDLADESINGIKYIFVGGSKLIGEEYKIDLENSLGKYSFDSMDKLSFDLAYVIFKNLPEKYVKEDFLNSLKELKVSGLTGDIKFKNNIAVRIYNIIQKSDNNYTIINNKE